MRIGYAYIEHGCTGGIERVSRELAGAMAKRGDEVHYHCSRSTTAPLPGVVVHRVWPPLPTNSARLAAFALRVPRLMGRGGYAITHSHGNIIGADVITAHSCHKAGLDRTASALKTPRERRMNFGIADRLRLYVERSNFAGRHYRAVIAVSHGVRQELMHEYGVPEGDIAVIPNGIDLTRFPKEARAYHRNTVRAAHGIPEGGTLLLFVGNEFRRKGLAVLLHALKLIDRQHVYLLVVGGDEQAPYGELARSLGIRDQVKFLGRVESVESLYLAADQFVLPSSYEAFSVAMLEAAAAGLPLILTPVSGTDEILVDGTTGLSVQPEPGSLAQAVRRVMEEESLGRMMGAAARRAAQRFTWDRIAGETAEIYSRILRHQTIHS